MTKHQNNDEIIEEIEQEEIESDADESVAEEITEDLPSQDNQIAELQEEVSKLKDLYFRSQAEMDNLRKRTQIELEKKSKFAISSFALDLLNVGDNLSRAMASIPKNDEMSDLMKNLMTGLELTQKELDSALEKNQITPIESQGLIFNPNLHKVVQEVDDPTKPNGTIIQEWQKGYMIGGDRVLREAVVIVTKGELKQPEPTERVDTTA